MAMEEEVANVQATTRDAIDLTPEEDCLSLPGIRNQLGVSQQVVQQVGVVHRLDLQLLAELVAFNALVSLLVLGEIEVDFFPIPLQLSLRAAGKLVFFLELPFLEDGGAASRSMMCSAGFLGASSTRTNRSSWSSDMLPARIFCRRSTCRPANLSASLLMMVSIGFPSRT